MDINVIKSKIALYQSNSLQTSNILWKAPAGKTQIRLVQYKHNKDAQFVELYFHFNLIANKPILSPISYGEPDPMIEFAQKLRKTGSKEDFISAKKLEPKLRVFTPIVVRGAEEEGVKIWGFGKTVGSELVSFIMDPDYGDITDAVNGRDIVVELITPQDAGNQYGKTNIRVKPNKTPLHTDAELVQKLLQNQPVIQELYKVYTYDELKEILRNYLNPENKGVDNKEEPVAEKESVTTKKAKSAKVESVEAAFNNMF